MKCLILILIIFSFNAQSKSLLLRVDVIKQTYTDYTVPCENKNKDFECISFSSWYIYTAKVLDVIDGHYKSKKIKFAVLQHGEYRKEYLKKVYVIIDEFINKETINSLGVKYFSSEIESAHEIICLPTKYVKNSKNKKFDYAFIVSENGVNTCFLTEYL